MIPLAPFAAGLATASSASTSAARAARGCCAARQLERDARLRSVRAGEACARRLGDARRFYTTPDSVEDLEAIRAELGVERLTLFGISYGTELALAYARAHPDRVDRLILDSVVDPDDRDPFGLAGFRAMGPSLAGLCPGRCRGVSRRPVQLVASAGGAAAGPRAARVRLRPPRPPPPRSGSGRPRSPTCSTTPTTTRRCGPPCRRRCAPRCAGTRRRWRGWSRRATGWRTCPRPKSFSSARYATVCEETPLPWDASTPLGDRLAEAQRRAAQVGPAAFFPFDLRTAAADEIGLCLRWPGVPSGRVPAPAAPVPRRPDAAAAGRGGPAHAARGLGARRGGHRRRAARGRCRASATPSSAATRAAAACARSRRFVGGKPAGGDCRARRDGRARGAAAAARAARASRRCGACAGASGAPPRRSA